MEQQTHVEESTAPQRISKSKNNVHSIENSSHPVHKTLATAANLANLLPTGTVLAFRTLIPPFANKGTCRPANKFLTASLIGFCAIACFFSSFTDSFVDSHGRLLYGVATFKGFYIFGQRKWSDGDDEEAGRCQGQIPSRFRISCVDFVHAFVSVFVFLIFSVGDSDVQNCFFPGAAGKDTNALVMNLPLGAGVVSTFLFLIFPSTRRGIGYADFPTRPW